MMWKAKRGPFVEYAAGGERADKEELIFHDSVESRRPPLRCRVFILFSSNVIEANTLLDRFSPPKRPKLFSRRWRAKRLIGVSGRLASYFATALTPRNPAKLCTAMVHNALYASRMATLAG